MALAFVCSIIGVTFLVRYLHKKKVEVYVVIQVDSDAWPDGVGQIRYGFDQNLIGQYESSFDFLTDYRQAVSDYEQVRRAIDSGKSGLDAQEVDLRHAMYRFTALKAIRKGDVITVEPLVPHALQHGVRVVEFQTPHYERYILSFGQEVVTQDHWDTDEALKVAKLDGESFSPSSFDNVIADFEEFTVQRIYVKAGETEKLDADKYQILMGIAGSMTCSPKTLITPESAWFLAPNEDGFEIRNKTTQPGVFLQATEK